MTDHNLDAYRTWIDSVLRPLVRKPLIEGMVRKWSVPSEEAVKAIGWLFDEVDFLKAAADNCMSERDAALAEVERLKANQPDGGEVRADERARIVRLLRLGGGYHRIADMIQSGLFGDVPSQSESKPFDTPPESTTDQTAPQTP